MIQLQLLENGPTALAYFQANGPEDESDYDLDSDPNVRRSRRIPRARYHYSKSVSIKGGDEDDYALGYSDIVRSGTTSRPRRLRKGLRKGSQKSSRQKIRQKIGRAHV